MPVTIQLANILDLNVDVIVNSAHPTLMAGGGVCGAIHAAAGPELEHAAMSLGPLQPGQAIVTPGFNLKARYVIHAVAPVYRNGDAAEVAKLAETYRSALSHHDQLTDVNSIAFPSIGTGIYNWPIEIASEIAIRELSKSQFELTIMCVMDKKLQQAYQQALDKASQ
ncbi:macro domain-containing protein [Solemya velum gill symbiont]|uniref:Macro domain-containing protein n=1 Tax=Solemya velum gill symbiont TaxID=2340 RepID=A0A1T2CHC9_SOVGS|nr:macro domain-containing protein [Solemya velum gill symbiont]OOY34287.1 hypothetical protein BOV88_11000 [Solemya velum gill symbiont]OOY37060.1 hypothetical protein BOV89_09570 [Solemya velum gill symbiont]OOY40277.1 hypothetical protein BOV90_05080 [Solemya velum gill symbiont]OOY44768.1 hypothetical protein BOV91_00400 [Solemya velum gill symbiont]OOY45270.1 hypothetical protein BOV92_05970 [Solemya velum gill symbiont]